MACIFKISHFILLLISPSSFIEIWLHIGLGKFKVYSTGGWSWILRWPTGVLVGRNCVSQGKAGSLVFCWTEPSPRAAWGLRGVYWGHAGGGPVSLWNWMVGQKWYQLADEMGQSQPLINSRKDYKMTLASIGVLRVEWAPPNGCHQQVLGNWVSPTCLPPLQEVLQDQHLDLIQIPFKLLLLPWVLEHVRFCVCPLRVDSPFATSL